MNLQFIADLNGKVKAVQIQIPIKEWNQAKGFYTIDKMQFSKEKRKMVESIKSALDEVQQIENGTVKAKSLEQLLNEIPEDKKQFVRKSIKKYEKDKSLLIDEEAAWKMINAENENS